MKRLTAVLSGLLALQIAGAVALGVVRPDYAAFRPSDPLVAFDAEAIDKITVQGEEQSVVLLRDEDRWILPDLHDFPADTAKIDKLIERLADMKRGLPVATSARAPERFKVAEDDFERRIVLHGGGSELGEILVGTSPSFRQAHVRTPEDDAVYSVEFALYDAGEKPDEWVNRDFLHLDAAQVERIELPSLALVRDGEDFTVEGLAEGETVAREAVDDLVEQVVRLRFSRVEGKGEKALARLAEPDMTVTVARKEGAEIVLRLRKKEEGDDYLLASSDHDYLFRATKYAVQDITEASRDKLVKPAEEESQDGASMSQSNDSEVQNGAG